MSQPQKGFMSRLKSPVPLVKATKTPQNVAVRPQDAAARPTPTPTQKLNERNAKAVQKPRKAAAETVELQKQVTKEELQALKQKTLPKKPAPQSTVSRPIAGTDEIDPALALADAAEQEAVYARDLIRFPWMLAKHGIPDEDATPGTAYRADVINRERINVMLEKYKGKK